MTTDTTHADISESSPGLSQDTVFELLFDEQRRYALRYLSQTIGPVSLDELVDGVARMQGELTRQRLDALALEFRHNHLCRLAAADVLEYDRDAETVERRPAARALDPYLDLSFGEDQ